MRRTVAPWSYPLILALLGVVLFFGHLSPAWRGIIGAESILFIGYLIARSRRSGEVRAPANLLPLFPGHLLLLFAIETFSPPPALLVGLWTVVPAASVVYDIIGASRFVPGRVSILSGVYCIIWADLFFLLEQIIKLGRELTLGEELVVGAVFVVVGIPFLGIGVYRHVRQVISKE